MYTPRSLWNRVALATVIATAAAGAAFASNSIAVPNGTTNSGNPCGVGNPNAARFSQDCGARVTFDGSTNDAFVQDNSPAAEGEYRVRFYINLRGTTTGAGGFDNFGAYTGSEPIRPVDAATQAEDYVEAMQLATCQPLVRMLLFFHVTDESRLEGLQSGVFYADGRPKPSLDRAARAARDAADGKLKCRT